MDRMNDVLHGIGGHDDFLSHCLASGSASRLSLMKSLCDRVERYDFRGSGELQRIVADFCERHAPDLPLHHLRPWAVATKALGFVILAVAGCMAGRICSRWCRSPIGRSCSQWSPRQACSSASSARRLLPYAGTEALKRVILPIESRSRPGTAHDERAKRDRERNRQ